MAKTDLPEWGFGFAPPNINPVDASFIKFFPCDSAETPSSNVDVNTQSYNAIFTVPVSHTRPPAWSRIAIQPHASTKFTGLIMKRVGLTPPRTVVNAHIIVQKESARAAAEREVEDEDRRIRRRLNNYEPSVQAAKLDGKPASQAEMAHLIMRAKVDASNNFMITSTSTPFADKQEARAGRLTQVCPVKRYRTVDYSTPLDPAGGNSFTIYREVIPIITRAMRKGMDEVDYTTASIATTSRIMRDMRRSRQPRLCLAAHGTPDLSDISDATEPDTSYSIKPPVIKAESRSPRKRIAKLTSTVKGGLKRLTQIVKLSPGSSPKAEPSPSKSDSTPSTPLRLSPPSLEPIITPSGVTPSMTTPFRDAATPSRPIITPSGVTPSLTTPFREVATPSRPIITPSGTQSPKFARPVAPTPSRWHRHEPFSPATAPSTPCQSDSPIGLATLIPPSTPTSAKCPYESPNGSDFRFGAMSPAFNNSISWMNPPIQASDSHRIKNLNSARRRQSEPLIRKYLKSQARRQSSSPRKVRFQDEDSLFENTSIASIFQSVQSNVAEAVDPAKTTVSVSDMTMADPTNADPAAAATPAAYAPTLEDGVLNIDMRQNLDIFHASPVSQLAEIAHDSCSGHAKVVVNEENGRLFVRFKLSAEHAHMFPASQGFNDSQFAFSPLAASRSPRITFNSRQPAFNPAQSTPPADETTPAAAEQSIASLTPTKSAEETIPAAAEQSIASLNPTPAADNSDKLAMNTTPIPAQTFTTSSFTPVNKTSPRTQITTPSGESQTTYKSTPAKNTEATENSVPSEAVSQQVYDDSPGRDYMRAFIKRSRRASTTEAGSPIAPPLKRKPLEAKSPNTPSPQKKRKLQKDEAKSPLGKQPEENQVPVPKRVRRTPKASRQKTDLAIDMEDHPASAVDATAQADEQEDGEEQNAPARRSTRLRSTRASSAPKSSIPTAIKLGGRSGAGRGTILNSTVRSDQQELNAQTRLNTKRNKGDAEYPAQVLARVAESGEVSDASEASSNTSGGSGDRKSVVWKDPLEDVQTEEKPKKGRTAAKAKATQGKTGIAKPSQKRSAKVAESLGMVANGTPARPKRMTRSQTRSQS
ncbi:hypothetical protein B0T10DRAFT_517503 [Thelonectria olida]|uniref:Uncharacterized protein n=1 Tax=Thelonectria olida TaxID=1576542 RepID=A0A9P8VZE1_9HYPO|nr:hypothetical protein B0T10DRAFT_517503 [Thelonectria olida]